MLRSSSCILPLLPAFTTTPTPLISIGIPISVVKPLTATTTTTTTTTTDSDRGVWGEREMRREREVGDS